MKKICVFCGSSLGHDSDFGNLAKELGREMASRKIGLVYGAGKTGIMGALADAVLENGGEVWGVIPKLFDNKELAHEKLTHIEVTEDMHSRKKRMYELADGFIALSGGVGTLEELSETVTWRQIGYHDGPLCLLNYKGHFDHLISYFDRMHSDGFMSLETRELLQVEQTVDGTLNRILEYIK